MALSHFGPVNLSAPPTFLQYEWREKTVLLCGIYQNVCNLLYQRSNWPHWGRTSPSRTPMGNAEQDQYRHISLWI